MLRHVIIGAGAVGCAIGGGLVRAGSAAVLVARGDHLTALQRTGLRIRTPDRDETVAVTAVAGPEDVRLDVDDILVATTKTQQLEAAVTAWADRPVFDGDEEVGTAGELLPFLTASNGVAAEGIALRYFRRVFGVCVWLPAVRLDPGEVIIRATPVLGVLHLGRAPTTASGLADAVLSARVAELWTRAGFRVPLPPDVMAWKYRKLISNLGNVLDALLGPQADAQELRQRAEREARQVFDAAGIVYIDDQEEKAARGQGFTIQTVPGVDGHQGSSTWQSLTRGTGDIETDFLNGEIAMIAHWSGRSAPINETLARLGRAAARSGASPGEVSVDALSAILDAASSRAPDQ